MPSRLPGFALATRGIPPHPACLGDSRGDTRRYAWDNMTAGGWDETANFTGMDEYWAGMRRFDEGEEAAWWNNDYFGDEGDTCVPPHEDRPCLT